MKKILLPVTLTASMASLAFADAPARKPNVIVIIADDLGYADLGMQGSKTIPTPHIDSIAKSGVRFTDAYATAPVSAPSRAAIITGRHQQRFGFEFNGIAGMPRGVVFGLPLGEKTLANRLQAHGYKTGAVGKWHLGEPEGYRPTDRGFDEFFGFWDGSSRYLPVGRTFPGNADTSSDKREQKIVRGLTPVIEEEYLTDAFGREASAFIERNHEKPFFLYLAFNAPHAPIQATEKYLQRFPEARGRAAERRRHYMAMVSAVDDNVGRVLDTLRKHGIEDDTLIFFASDNGGAEGKGVNTPLRGFKQDVWEGGIRVPFCLQWKKQISGGRVDSALVSLMDITATALAATGAPAAETGDIDGANLLPYLAGKITTPPHDRLFWRYGTRQCAVRENDWKLVKNMSSDWHLYNLRKDIAETTDLIAAETGTQSNLLSHYQKWNATLRAPLWVKDDRMDYSGRPVQPKTKQPRPQPEE